MNRGAVATAGRGTGPGLAASDVPPRANPAIRHEELELAQLAVDTHGHTDFAMALAKLLSFDLCPRLKTLKDRHLFVPGGTAIPDSVRAICRATVDLDRIRKHWDEAVRLVASVHCGHTSAVHVTARYGSAARGDPLFEAISHLGRLLRTVFLCDYFLNDAFCREILRVLNRGEAVNAPQACDLYRPRGEPPGQAPRGDASGRRRPESPRQHRHGVRDRLRVRADRVLYFSVNAYDGLCVNRRLRPPAPCVPQAQSLLPEPPARSRGSISASATTTTWSCSGSWLRFAWGECFLETPPYAGNKVARFYIAETASPSFLS